MREHHYFHSEKGVKRDLPYPQYAVCNNLHVSLNARAHTPVSVYSTSRIASNLILQAMKIRNLVHTNSKSPPLYD
jgi:hypothetical protein